MNTEILSADKDPMGAAILDFQKHGKAARLRVLSSMFEEDEMPITHLFRSVPEMPVLEQKALQLAKGRVLDIGDRWLHRHPDPDGQVWSGCFQR